MPNITRRLTRCTCLVAVLLTAGASGAFAQPDPATPARDCAADAQWQAGLAEQPAADDCTGEGGEAYLLARELARLRAESRAIEQARSIQAEADRGAASRRLRQLQIDIEAIEAEARLRGWSGRPPSP